MQEKYISQREPRILQEVFKTNKGNKMKVNENTKRLLRVRRNCPHWFVATEMTQTSKRISGVLDMPFYVPIYSVTKFECCVCGANPSDVYNKIAKKGGEQNGRY